VRTLWFLPRLFAFIGAVCFTIAYFVWRSEQRFIAGAARTTGAVVSLDYRRDSDGGGAYYPVFRFRDARGQSFTVRSHVGSRPASRHVGEQVEVLYPPDDPDGARIASFFNLHLGSFVFGILTAVTGGIGFTWLTLQRRRAARVAELRAGGRRLEATVKKVELRMNFAVNGRHPWRIIAEYDDPAMNERYVFRSPNLWSDPTPHVGETVGVFVDHHDMKRYAMDLDFLPKEG